MKQFIIEGMSCASCQARIEKVVKKLEGVTSCSVSLLTNTMGVEGTAKDSDIINAVVKAGFQAYVKKQEIEQNSNKQNKDDDILKDTETEKLIKRLISSIIFSMILMYITMGHNMLNMPLPLFLNQNYLALAITQMLLAIMTMIINKKFFINGYKNLINFYPNMDTLVALGSSVSFLWSLGILYHMTNMIVVGHTNLELMHYYHNDLYFESAAMIPTFITIGKTLESLSKGRTTDALKSLMKLAPKKAIIIENDEEKEVDIADVKIGDIFKVYPGQNISVDGVVIDGISAVNESALTGESVPVNKTVGDKVSQATINESGILICKAERVGNDTTLNQIINMVSEASATKAPIARIADRVSVIFVPSVIILAVVVVLLWIFIGNQDLSFAIARGISVLVISCPCALGLATPVAIMVGNGKAARNGILFKTSEALELFGKTKIIALDKTGTITKGEPNVTDICHFNIENDEELIQIAYSLESNSEHPLAKAIVNYVNTNYNNMSKLYVENFKILPGNGLVGMINNENVSAGSIKYMSEKINLNDEEIKKAEQFASVGKTPLFFEKNSKLIGIIAVADEIKDDSKQGIEELNNLKIETIMLTGDNEKTANAIAKQALVNTVVANVLPEGKESKIRELKNKGKVAMVGDGINDAPALVRADIGVAIGAGTDVAIDSADIVLMNNSIRDVASAVRLSRATLLNIYENLFWAFFYNLICIPLAAGVFSIKMNPMIAAAAMIVSSISVCLNALRLNLFNMKKV